MTWSGDPREVHLDYSVPTPVPRGSSTLLVDIADATPAGTDRSDVALRVTVTDGGGRRASAALGPDGVLPRQLPGQFTTLAPLMPIARSEPTLHTLAVDLARLDGVDAGTIEAVTVTLVSPSGSGCFVGDVRLGPATVDAGR